MQKLVSRRVIVPDFTGDFTDADSGDDKRNDPSTAAGRLLREGQWYLALSIKSISLKMNVSTYRGMRDRVKRIALYVLFTGAGYLDFRSAVLRHRCACRRRAHPQDGRHRT